MVFNWFIKKRKNCLGIDIGSANIKIVELGKAKTKGVSPQLFLVNYGIVGFKRNQQSPGSLNTSEIKKEIDFHLIEPEEVAKILKAGLSQAGITIKDAVFSLPTYSTFSTLMTLPAISEKELDSAIKYEARKYVPVSLDEVVLDWSLVSLPPPSEQRTNKNKKMSEIKNAQEVSPESQQVQALLIAVPKETIERFTQIAKEAKLNLISLELENFSLVRALIGQGSDPICILDLGAKNWTLNVADNSTLKVIHNLQLASVDDKIEAVSNEIKKISSLYFEKSKRQIKKFLVSGGQSQAEIINNLQSYLNFEFKEADPFLKVSYPEQIGIALKEIGPQMSIGIGLAMRGL